MINAILYFKSSSLLDRIKDEIDGLKPEGKERSDEKTNTMKYLALTLPPSHNEGKHKYSHL